MMHIKNKSHVELRKIVIFGAGKIGRSFIGQLFGCSGYQVTFIDVDPVMIKLLNEKGCYRIVIKGDKEEEILIQNVKAISAQDRQNVIDAVSTASILAVSVGKNALEKVIPVIVSGISQRHDHNPEVPLDIILAENMRSAAEFVKGQLLQSLPSGFPVESYVGLIETSIGKMVPIIPLSELDRDPLVVFAEPYNTLILDGKGFKSSIPRVKGLAPKTNIKAWVDRKAFIHNLGHAAAAYYGYHLHPDSLYMYEILEDKEVYNFTRSVMLQSADILRVSHPGEFSAVDLQDHIDDLIKRFMNKALQDTIYRVGQDLPRKLGCDDRFMSPIHLAIEHSMPYDLIIKAMTYGLFFRARSEEGNLYPADKAFLDKLEQDFDATLMNDLGLDITADLLLVKELTQQYAQIQHNLNL